MTDTLQVKAGIICDSFRREDNGKLILIGVYTGTILASAFPANLVLCCIVIANATKSTEIEIEFEALLDGNTQMSGKGKVTIGGPGEYLWPIPNIALQNLNTGTLTFRLRENGGQWQTIVEAIVGPLPT